MRGKDALTVMRDTPPQARAAASDILKEQDGRFV
jgi:hypothetical protein